MKTLIQAAAAACLAFASTAVAPAVASAHDYTIASLRIEHPWARPTVTDRQPGAAYFIIHNDGETDDRLIDARPQGFAEAAELHTHINDDGVMRMRRVQDGVPVPAGESTAFEPGGLHVMLYGLSGPLTEGDLHTLTLVFESAGEVEVGVYVHNYDRADGGGHQH